MKEPKTNEQWMEEIVEKFDEEFCPNDIWDTSKMMFEIKYFLSQSLKTAYSEGRRAGILEARECVPDETAYVVCDMEEIKDVAKDCWNACREQTLTALDELLKK